MFINSLILIIYVEFNVVKKKKIKLNKAHLIKSMAHEEQTYWPNELIFTKFGNPFPVIFSLFTPFCVC